MKKKELQSYAGRSKGELQKELLEEHEKLAKLRFDLAAGKVKNIREMRHLKKNIAQLLTLLKNIK